MASPDSIAIVKGQKVPRIDAPLKVTGQAQYTSDFNFPRMAYAVPVCATIGKGKVRKVDSSAASKMKGVLAVYTHENFKGVFRPTYEQGFEFRVDEPRPPFEDDIVRYYGQYIAAVVAETFEIAQAAARSIKVTYAAEKPNVSGKLDQEDLKKVDTTRGNAQQAFSNSPIKIDQTYFTPVEVHNPIELHSTVALWSGRGTDAKVTIYEASQAVGTHRNVIAQQLGVPRENVRVICKFLGSGFGGKLWAWPHSVLAAESARKLGRAVKLVVDRHMMFTNVGHRPRTQQRFQLGADKDGRLQSIIHTYASQSSPLDEYKENCGEATGVLYNCENVHVTSGIARRNQAVPTSMRGPGAVPGIYALENAMDELAVALNMDPVKLRLINDTLKDGSAENRPFSSRHFKECLELGAKKFGWEKRTAAVGSMKRGDEIIGWGVSGCLWQAQRLDAEATVDLQADGRIRVSCGTHDIGTGMYTVLAEIIREETGVPHARVDILLGDTSLPNGPLAGGSMATASVIPAVTQAVRKAMKNLTSAASKISGSPFNGQKAEDVKFANGKVSAPKGGSVEFGKLISQMNMRQVSASGSSKGTFAEKKGGKFSMFSFGAQFLEVGWQPEIARLRVHRIVSVIDAGKILNFQPARNQIEGGIVMGLGMGLFEEAVYDPRDGMVANGNLADYVVAVHADCPEIDVTFLDYPDKALNEYGARGVGEIGTAGVASALCSAVYHATGVRVRELPISIEKILAGTMNS